MTLARCWYVQPNQLCTEFLRLSSEPNQILISARKSIFPNEFEHLLDLVLDKAKSTFISPK